MEDKSQIKLQGVAAAPGVAFGPAFVLLQKRLEIPFFRFDASQVNAELQRFDSAVLQARAELARLRSEVAQQLGEEEAQIFDAHIMVLEDPAFLDGVSDGIRANLCNAEFNLKEVADRFVQAFQEISDSYLKERVKDLQDVTRRVLRILMGEKEQTFAALGHGHIIASEDITTSDAAALEHSKVLGILTDIGSRTSHAVIIAQSLGIPAVVGLHDITATLENDDEVLIDGFDGLVFVNPSQETRYRYGQLREKRIGIERIFREAADLPGQTGDGLPLLLTANVASPDEARIGVENGAEGVGLFRTEAFFIRGGRFPSEEEQFHAYDQIAAVMHPRPVVMRTLDMGGDKQFSSIGFNLEERNPFMGFRAIRFCLEHVDVFKQQLRAILRASTRRNVRIMFPMISSLCEFKRAKALTEEAMDELKQRGVDFDPDILIGTMIEVPSAAVIADQLARHSAFFSLGTNDLIQYLLAVDRINDRIAHLYEPSHPAVLRTIRGIADAAKSQGIPISVCGEMASDPLYVPFLVGIGASQLSVSPMNIPEVKYLVRRMKSAKLKELCDEVLEKDASRDVELVLHNFFHELMADMIPLGYYRGSGPAMGFE